MSGVATVHAPTLSSSWSRTQTSATRVLVAYTVLFVLEGAVRKWVPALDSLFYIARDMLLAGAAALYYLQGLPRRRHHWWAVLWAATLVLFTHGCVTIIGGTMSPTALAFGIRSYVIAALLTAFVASYAPRRALDAISTTLAILALVNLPIAIAQVLSPGDAFVNRVTGGGENNWLNGGEAVRALGTFSSPVGMLAFLPLTLALSLAAVARGTHHRTLHALSVVATALMTVISGSRGIVLCGVIVAVAFVIYQLRHLSTRAFLNLLVILGLGVGGLIAANHALATVLEAFQTRVDQASAQEDTAGRITRTIFGFATDQFGLLGSGPGANSTFGSQQLGTPWVEFEHTRYTAELGVLGYALAIAATAAGIWAAIRIFTHSHHDPPERTLILAVVAPALTFGSVTAQPSAQASIALCAAALLLTTLPDHEPEPSSLLRARTRDRARDRSHPPLPQEARHT
ncbi:hypothetical protein [Demequina subtropica]|uniref:hypothetical protein n=1 Tax=Demequina subtropica TaxID=1638989 RepID=UPI000784A23E|nr:hypothetical protein [Demequina subtropica]